MIKPRGRKNVLTQIIFLLLPINAQCCKISAQVGGGVFTFPFQPHTLNPCTVILMMYMLECTLKQSKGGFP